MTTPPNRPLTLVEARSPLPKGTREIQLNDLKYKPDMNLAALCVEFCSLSYRPSIKHATPGSYREAKKRVDTLAHIYGYEGVLFSAGNQQAAIFYNRDQIFVAFEGSLPDQLSHYNRNLTPYLTFRYAEAPKSIGGFVHAGFNSALDQPLVNIMDTKTTTLWEGIRGRISGAAQEPEQSKTMTLWEGLREKLHEIRARHPNSKLYFTGHSAGGAIAEIALAREFDSDRHFKIDGLYTFGQPRVGNRQFKDSIDRKTKGHYFRFEQYGDPMPALPPRDLKMIYGEYVHGGQWIPMDSTGRFLGIDVDPAFKIEDTLSRSDPTAYDRAIDLYNHILGRSIAAIRTAKAKAGSSAADIESADQPVIEAAIKAKPPLHSTGEDRQEETFSGLMSLFFPKNFYAHSLRSYRNGILDSIKNDPDKEKAAAVGEHQAQHLLLYMINLEDHLKNALGAMLDSRGIAADQANHLAAEQAIQGCISTIGPILNGWDGLRTDPTAHLQSGLPPFYYLKVWAAQPDRRITPERATFVRELQDKTRHARIEIVCDALAEVESTLQSLGFAHYKHEELRTLIPDIRACRAIAEDVLSITSQQGEAKDTVAAATTSATCYRA